MSNKQTPPSPQPTFDFHKWVQDVNRQEAHRAHDKLDDFHTYVNQGAVKAGQSALQMAMLINGGAAVALLSFISDLPVGQKQAIANSLVWFAFGVVTAVAAIAASYFADLFMAATASSRLRTYAHPYLLDGPQTKSFTRLNRLFHVLAVVVGISSLVLFVCGVLEVRRGFAITQPVQSAAPVTSAPTTALPKP